MTRLEAIAAHHARQSTPTDAVVTLTTSDLQAYAAALAWVRLHGGKRLRERLAKTEVG